MYILNKLVHLRQMYNNFKFPKFKNIKSFRTTSLYRKHQLINLRTFNNNTQPKLRNWFWVNKYLQQKLLQMYRIILIKAASKLNFRRCLRWLSQHRHFLFLRSLPLKFLYRSHHKMRILRKFSPFKQMLNELTTITNVRFKINYSIMNFS